jgi:3-isopropylmalate/(R)-2-methylmalate dehydratase large subunit
MGMTMAEKVLARASGQQKVEAGQYVTARADRLMAHEGFALCALTLQGMGIAALFDPDRVVVMLDHYFPAPSVRFADAHNYVRQAVEDFGVKHFLGHSGICHQVMCEQGFVLPGQLIVGTDSHSTTYGALGAAGAGIGQTEMSYIMATGELWFQVPPTIRMILTGEAQSGIMAKDIILKIAGTCGTDFAQYRAIEFAGDAANRLSIAGRMTVSNMGIEVGAKFAFFEADEKAVAYLRQIAAQEAATFGPDADAVYERVRTFDISTLDPQVACPHNPGNVKPAGHLAEVTIDQAFLGSCTNGRLEDLAVAAQILKGQKVHPRVRMLIAPASQQVTLEAAGAGFLQTLLEAGAHLMPAGCGPCPGGHMGLLGAGETCISSTNRNFPGRMGSENSSVYLGSPATVAASAINGYISDPREFWNETTVCA